MKKNYISPSCKALVIRARMNLLTLSNTEAKGGESNFAREVDFELDGEY